MKRAPLAARFFAFVIDVALVGCLAALITASIVTGYFLGANPVYPGSPINVAIEIVLAFFLTALLLFLFYFTYLNVSGETTPGKSLFRIRVVRKKDDGGLGWGRAFVRACAYAFSAFPLFLGFFMAFFLKGRALHDLIAATRVTRED